MTTSTDIGLLTKNLRKAFPNLSEPELATAVATAALSGRSNAVPATTVTVREYLKVVRKVYRATENGRLRAPVAEDGEVPTGKTTTYRTYDTHWRRFDDAFGERLLGEVLPSDLAESISKAGLHAQETCETRNESRKKRGLPPVTTTGVSARNGCRAALRALFAHAVADGVIEKNPMDNSSIKALKTEPKVESARHAISERQLEQLFDVALAGGNDPQLDYIILWMMAETACRREAILNLRVSDLRRHNQTILLCEKNDRPTAQPVTVALLDALSSLASTRGSVDESDPVFRYHPEARGRGRPMSRKRFETLYNRLSAELEWVRDESFTGHWLRHTTTTWCERNFGLAVARAYARHKGGPVTLSYSKPDVEEVANALAALTGTEHPLAAEAHATSAANL